MRSARPLRSLLVIAASSAFMFATASAAAAQCTLQAIGQSYDGVAFFNEIPESGDAIGESLTTGDFDGDGLGDIVFGSPRESISGQSLVGLVYVAYGKVAHQKFTQADIPSQVHVASSQFGIALGAGDFNGDGYDDLVVQTLEAADGFGYYFVIPGSASGLRLPATKNLKLSSDRTRTRMTSGDLDADGRDDLVIGQPGHIGACPSSLRQGRVIVAFGSATKAPFERMQVTDASLNHLQCGGNLGSSIAITTVNGAKQIIAGQPQYNLPGSPNTPSVGGYMVFEVSKGGRLMQTGFYHGVQAWARYGHSLATGDFDDDGGEDLAIGAPGSLFVAGWVRVAYHNGAVQLISRSQFGGPSADWFGEFGATLAAGNFDGPGADDLIIGEPQYGAPEEFPGAILIARGNANGLAPVHAEYMFVPGENPLSYGSRLAVTDVEGDGTDEFIVGNYHGKLTASHPVNSGFVSRGTFLNLDECAPL